MGRNNLLNGGLICVNEKIIIVKSKSGAAWLLILAISNLILALMIAAVFYEIPKRFFGQYRPSNNVSKIKVTYSLDTENPMTASQNFKDE